MWYKVRELFEKGLNKTQISLELGIHRKTVRKYLSLSEDEFYHWLEKPRNLPRKLNDYYEYVRKLLEGHPYLSAAQVEDRLKEHFTDLPMVHSKTIYNFVQSIRRQHGIKKQEETRQRQYQKLPEPEYGVQAQADFGEYAMLTSTGGRKKVYFFVMVLCRSRQKFVYFKTTPFTTTLTSIAHDKSFAYFNGQTREVIYDQDRVLISDENLGDVLLTQEFQIYCNQMDFKPVFCRKSDPESKGKVENVVGYIKKNFLRGRIFHSEEILNQEVLAWLLRTGNGKVHNGTRKVPAKEWETERNYLLPLKHHPAQPASTLYKYKVRKDNTISYKSNFYTLPLGTYQGPDTWVFLRESEKEILIFNEHQELLTSHELCLGKGMTIRNSDHYRDKSQGILNLCLEIEQMLPQKDKARLYLEMLYKEKPRYVRDNLLILKKHIPLIEKDHLSTALDFCLENQVYNAARLMEIATHYQKESQLTSKVIIPDIVISPTLNTINITPKTSQISTYENIL